MSGSNDGVALFTCMLGQTTILYLHHTLELSAYDFDAVGLVFAIEYDETAFQAAQEMISLAKTLGQLNSFKVSTTLLTIVSSGRRDH
jgi:hypothetical protein